MQVGGKCTALARLSACYRSPLCKLPVCLLIPWGRMLLFGNPSVGCRTHIHRKWTCTAYTCPWKGCNGSAECDIVPVKLACIAIERILSSVDAVLGSTYCCCTQDAFRGPRGSARFLVRFLQTCEGCCEVQVCLAVQQLRGITKRPGGRAQPASNRRRLPGDRAVARGHRVDAGSSPLHCAPRYPFLLCSLCPIRRLPQRLVRASAWLSLIWIWS